MTQIVITNGNTFWITTIITLGVLTVHNPNIIYNIGNGSWSTVYYSNAHKLRSDSLGSSGIMPCPSTWDRNVTTSCNVIMSQNVVCDPPPFLGCLLFHGKIYPSVTSVDFTWNLASHIHCNSGHSSKQKLCCPLLWHGQQPLGRLPMPACRGTCQLKGKGAFPWGFACH